MASYGSDEEQLEALKNWWNENGTSLLMGIALVLVVFFGNRWWQGNVNAEKEGASEIYATMMETMAVNLDNAVSDEDLASMRDTYSQLLGEFPDSIYVRYAALMLASAYVGREEYDAAAEQLGWVLDNQELGFMQEAEPELFLSTRLKLARVKLAQEEPQAALDLVSAVEPGGLAASYAEVQGDAYVQLGQIELARSAYERALALLPENAAFIDLKLSSLSS